MFRGLRGAISPRLSAETGAFERSTVATLVGGDFAVTDDGRVVDGHLSATVSEVTPETAVTVGGSALVEETTPADDAVVELQTRDAVLEVGEERFQIRGVTARNGNSFHDSWRDGLADRDLGASKRS